MVWLYALDEYFGCVGAGDYQRGPDFLLGMLVVQHPPHAKGGGPFARCIADARAPALVWVDDSVVNAVGCLVAQSRQELADLRFEFFEVRRHVFAGGGKVGNGKRGV